MQSSPMTPTAPVQNARPEPLVGESALVDELTSLAVPNAAALAVVGLGLLP